MIRQSTHRPLAELARAKVNLALHVTGKREDGYHLLESLVAFPQLGDRLSMTAAKETAFLVEGPFSRDLGDDQDKNLVQKAVRAFAETASTDVPALDITLTKRLPIASGIGGGSSDAAATLRLLEKLTNTRLPKESLHKLALSLGADVPVCLTAEPKVMRGIGEDLEAAPLFPDCGIVLVNPRIGISTPAVFKALTQTENPDLPPLPDKFADLAALVSYLVECRNDLQDAAISICGEIGGILEALEADTRVLVARMSGSGATCFALCSTKETARIESDLRAAHPHWWIASAPLS